MNVHRLANCALVRAPAKLNLFFEVLGKRDDGYHEIETLMVPISLCDTLIACGDASGSIRVSCRWAAPDKNASEALGILPTQAENLATKAIELLRDRAGTRQGLRLEIIKRIPSAAGFGGGSTDAAAALLAANDIWNLGWSRDRLSGLAAELGSDVPFFLGSGAAICRGRGEHIESVGGFGSLHFAVIRPCQGLSTAAVYSQCRPARDPRSPAPLLESLRSGSMRRVARLIHNQLEEAAEELSPWIGRLRKEFEHEDCLAARMSGSGTGYFGMCHNARHARRVARRLQARGLGQAFAVSTSN